MDGLTFNQRPPRCSAWGAALYGCGSLLVEALSGQVSRVINFSCRPGWGPCAPRQGFGIQPLDPYPCLPPTSTPSGEGRQGSPGGGGAEPAAQQPAAAGRVRERGHPPALGLQAAGLPGHRPGLSLQAGLSLAAHLLELPGCSGPLGRPNWALLRNSPCGRRTALPHSPAQMVAQLPSPYPFVNILWRKGHFRE